MNSKEKWVSQGERAQTPALTAPRNATLWATETAQWLKALTPPSDNLGSIAGTHTAPHNHL